MAFKYLRFNKVLNHLHLYKWLEKTYTPAKHNQNDSKIWFQRAHNNVQFYRLENLGTIIFRSSNELSRLICKARFLDNQNYKAISKRLWVLLEHVAHLYFVQWNQIEMFWFTTAASDVVTSIEIVYVCIANASRLIKLISWLDNFAKTLIHALE